MKLSDRIRPGVECAPWVYDEVCCLEAERDVLLADRAMYSTTLKTSESLLGCEHFGEIPQEISGLQAERDQLRAELAELRPLLMAACWYVRTTNEPLAEAIDAALAADGGAEDV